MKRKKIVDDTQITKIPLFKHETRRGNPTKPEIRSENAKEASSMLVIDCKVLFLQIKKTTKPFTSTMSKQMKAKSTIIDAERISWC